MTQLRPRIVRSRALAGAVAMGLCGALALGLSAPSAADDIDDQRAAAEQRQQDLQAARDTLSASLEDTNAQLAQAVLDLQTIQARLPQAQAELAAAQVQVQRTAREADLLAQRLQNAQDTEKQVAAEVAAGAAQAEAAKNAIAQMAREAVRGTGDISGLGIVTGAQSAEEFVQNSAISSTAARNQARVLDDLQRQESIARNREARLVAIRQTVADLKAQADDNLAAAQVAQQQAADRKAEIDHLIAAQQQKNATIAAARDATQAEIDQNEQDAADNRTEIKRIIAAQTERDRKIAEAKAKAEAEAKAKADAEAAKAKAEAEAKAKADAAKKSGSGSGSQSGSGGQSGTRTTVQRSSGYLSYPVADTYVTSSYGMRLHPILNIWRMHAGTDFHAPCGAPIMAAAGGKVVIAKTTSNGTNEVVVDHGWVDGASLMTGYLHLSRFAVSTGQQVARGQVIGYSGTTGLSTGCHLHFEVYINGDTVNPMSRL